MEEQPCKVTVLLQHPFSERNKDQLLSRNGTQLLVALLYCKDSQHKFQANLDFYVSVTPEKSTARQNWWSHQSWAWAHAQQWGTQQGTWEQQHRKSEGLARARARSAAMCLGQAVLPYSHSISAWAPGSALQEFEISKGRTKVTSALGSYLVYTSRGDTTRLKLKFGPSSILV